MKPLLIFACIASAGLMILAGDTPTLVLAQEQATTTSDEAIATPEPLSDEEMEIVVARIALYPDELVAAISAAALYPLQIVQAQRYLDKLKSNPDLKPDKNWDGSVISLLNYPEVVKMMNDDLDWTEALGEAVTNQQKEMLEAIQELRDKAVAQGVLKSDDKTVVTQDSGHVVIQPASVNEIYVPVYEPQMLYEPDYAPVPITYYPEPYPSYYYPTAPFFAGFVTGAVWGAVIDWNDWGVWGGNGNWGNDVEINCNNCFNNRDFNGKVNWNDVDWNNVDRSKISFDKNQFTKFNNNEIRRGLEGNAHNNLKSKAGDLKRNQAASGQQKKGQAKDVRKSTVEGLQKEGKQTKKGGGKDAKSLSQGAGKKPAQGSMEKAAKRNSNNNAVERGGKSKPSAKKDGSSKKASSMDDLGRDQKSKKSNRGGQGMNNGMDRGGSQKIKRRPPGGDGDRGGGRGGRR